MVSGVPYPAWGCYTTNDASCKCEAKPKYDDDDDDYRHGHRDEYEGRDWKYNEYDDEEEAEEKAFGRDDEDETARRHSIYRNYEGAPDEDEEEGFRRYEEDYANADDEPYSDDYHGEGGHDGGRGLAYVEAEDDEYDEARQDSEDEEEGEGEVAKTDYNAEYYHGEAKGENEDQDEGQPQTGEQFMLGPHLLVQPITSIKASQTNVYLPADTEDGHTTWFDLHTGEAHSSTPGARVIEVALHSDHVPAFLRAGSVLPKRERLRRSSRGTHIDPFTLVVAPDGGGHAAGELFLDRYDGYDDESEFTAKFTFAANVLRCAVAARTRRPPAASSPIERIVFWGQPAPREVLVRTASGKAVPGVQATYDEAARTITVRQPKVTVGEVWSVELLAPAA